jgi:hypothetical protein
LVIAALTAACAPAVNVEGGSCENETDGGCATIVVVAIAGLEGVVAGETAVMVTTLPLGITAGAV